MALPFPRLSPPRMLRHWLPRYLLAVVAVSLALGTSVALARWLAPSIFLLFFPAVVAVAWLAGSGPAIVAIVLAVASVEAFLLAPRGEMLTSGPVGLIPLFAFAVVAGAIVYLNDVSRRRSAALEAQAEELRRTREFLEQAQRTAQIGSWEWDVASNTVTWSPELYRVYGLAEGSEQSFESFLAAVHPEDRERVRETVEQALGRQSSFQFDHRVVRPDGAIRWLHGRGRVETDGAGKVVRMVGSAQDITERRRWTDMQSLLAEASAVLASTTDYQRTLDNLAQLVVRSMADWCSIAIGDASGAHEVVVVTHRDPERARRAAELAARDAAPHERRIGHASVLRDGRTVFHPELSAEVLRAMSSTPEELRLFQEVGLRSLIIVPMIARGRVLGSIAFVAAESGRAFDADDVWLAERLAIRAASAIDTARLFEEARAARLNAEHANRAKMDFLAAMSHELRTPLNAIGGYAELLEMGIHGPLAPAQLEAVQRLRRSQKSLHGLVEDILSFAKLEAGKVEVAITEVPLNDVLERVRDITMPLAGARSQQLVVRGTESYPRVLADPARLEQVLVNLVGNAIKFTPDSGRIEVAVRREEGMVAVAVSDTGIGIDEAQFELIFEPFTQLSRRLDERKPGVGLGLTISRELARAMGGDIVVASRPGEGSTFTLVIPSAGRAPSVVAAAVTITV